MTTAVATILRLALVTGQRIGEIAGMTQAEIDCREQPHVDAGRHAAEEQRIDPRTAVTAGSRPHQRRHLQFR